MNGVLWHTVLFGTGRILKRHHSELALDRLDTGDPFGVHPQQNDTDGQPCLFLCKGWLSEYRNFPTDFKFKKQACPLLLLLLNAPAISCPRGRGQFPRLQ